MAAPGTAPIHIALDSDSASAATDDLLAATLRANPHVSDLIFSPGRKLQVQVHGEFVAVELPGLRALTADDTRRVASTSSATIKRPSASCASTAIATSLTL